jgi:hypothetical protein
MHSGLMDVILLHSLQLITNLFKTLRIFLIYVPNVRASVCQLNLIWFILASLRILLIQQRVARILGTLNNTFKPTLVQKYSTIKVYNTLAVHILLYGSEIWALRKKDKKDWHQSRLNFSEEQSFAPFLATNGIKKFWKSWK